MAFYDDMQDVATELLTEFGKSITFSRITKTFNKITGKNTTATTATTATVGVEIPINQRLVDGTRIQSGDRSLIIDASYAPVMADTVSLSGETWSIVEIQPIKPADTVIAYRLQVRK